MSNKQISIIGLVVSLLALMITCGQLTVEVAALLAQTNRLQVPVFTPLPALTNTPPTPTDTPSPVLTVAALAFTPEFARLVINSSTLNVRSGPGTNYPAIGQANDGERYYVTGKNVQGTWYQIAFDGQSGWVAGEFVGLEGDPGALQVVSNLPPPPLATSTPLLSPTVTSVQPYAQASASIRPEPYVVLLLLAIVALSASAVFFLRNWFRLK